MQWAWGEGLQDLQAEGPGSRLEDSVSTWSRGVQTQGAVQVNKEWVHCWAR